MTRTVFLMAALSALMVLPATAQDAEKKGKGKGQNDRLVAQFLKQLEAAKLTDDQVAKVKEAGKEINAKMLELRKEAGITPELQKKRAEAVKALQDSDKKGKDRIAAINEEAGLTEAQAAAMEKMTGMRQEFQRKVFAMLSDEQKAALPERLQKSLKAGGQKVDRKKKDKS